MATDAPALLAPAGGDAARQLRGEIASFIGLSAALLLMSRVVQRAVVPGLTPALHMAYSWGLLLVLLVPVALYVRRQSLPLSRLDASSCRADPRGLARIRSGRAGRAAAVA
ncbi:hypothetical protein WME89_04905 [Sorangium sp. So ce321]|uniref:hypothetical protein n=1 Tax=Sorangium sp. So ce321 TaxID=3133300 RepID=UPI003F631C28